MATPMPMLNVYELDAAGVEQLVYRPMTAAELTAQQQQQTENAAADAAAALPAPGDLVTQPDGTHALVIANNPSTSSVTLTPLAAPATVAAKTVNPIT